MDKYIVVVFGLFSSDGYWFYGLVLGMVKESVSNSKFLTNTAK